MPNGPYTFEQWYESENNPWVRYVLDSYIECENIISRLPMETYADQKRLGKRVIGGLPMPTNIAIGPEPTTPFVVPVEDYDEGCYLIEDNFDFHRLFGINKNGVYSNVEELHVRNYLKARSFLNNFQIIANDHVNGNINAPVGLKYRMNNPAVYGNSAALRLQASADLSDSGISQIGASKLERDFQTICNRMGRPDGKGLLALGSPQCLAQIDQQIKYSGSSGGFKTTEDGYERILRKWRNMEIASVGYGPPTNAGVQTVPIISDGQDALGNWPANTFYGMAADTAYNSANANSRTSATGGNFTSMFIVVKDDGTRFGLWQMEAPRLYQFKPVSGTRLNRVCIDQTLGIWQPDTLAVALYYGLNTNGPANS